MRDLLQNAFKKVEKHWFFLKQFYVSEKVWCHMKGILLSFLPAEGEVSIILNNEVILENVIRVQDGSGGWGDGGWGAHRITCKIVKK